MKKVTKIKGPAGLDRGFLSDLGDRIYYPGLIEFFETPAINPKGIETETPRIAPPHQVI